MLINANDCVNSTRDVNYSNKCTIVTAFISNINERGDRNMQKYVDLGYKLLDVNIRQILFIERQVFELYFRNRYSHLYRETDVEQSFTYNDETYTYIVLGHITIVFFEKTSLYFHSYRNNITEFSVSTQYQSKDTLEYMFVQCHKTEWVNMAICLDKHVVSGNSSMYIWVDFGIRHMFPSDISFDMEMYQLRDRVLRNDFDSAKVYAPSCWNPDYIYYLDIYTVVHWVFAGSVFGGSPTILQEFARRTKEKCLSIISEKHRLMWEVNVWYMVLLECPDMFLLYSGDHNATILRGFLQ